MKVETDAIRTKETDDRGRLYLGTEYANKRVTVAIVADDLPSKDELASAYRDAAESTRDINREGEHASTAWNSLGPAPRVGSDAVGEDDE